MFRFVVGEGKGEGGGSKFEYVRRIWGFWRCDLGSVGIGGDVVCGKDFWGEW